MALNAASVSTPLRVAHFGNCPLPPSMNVEAVALRTRNPGRWVLDHAVAQRALPDIEPRLLTVVRGLSHDVDTQVDGVDVSFIASRYRACLLRAFCPDRRKLKRAAVACAANIVHAHGTEFAYALAAQDTRIPYVITAQGLMFMIIPRMRPRLFSWLRLIRVYEHLVFKKANHVIAKSDLAAAALQQRYPHLTIHRIPNTFDPRLLDIRESRQANTLVFVGTIIPNKGLHLLRAALEHALIDQPDIRLWIVGDLGHAGDVYERREIAALRHQLGNRLVTFGRVSGLDVARIVAQASLLVAPTRWEMFGNQLIEALLVGTHGIVTDQTALAENARRYGNATVVPQQDPKCLADTIVGALKRNLFPDRETARNRIRADMAPAAVAKAHAVLYRRIVAEHAMNRKP